MNEDQPGTPTSLLSRIVRSFAGSCTVLRVFAGLSVVCLGAGWVTVAVGSGSNSALGFFLCSQGLAFIAGVSSLSPLGGISSVLAVMSLRAFVMHSE